MIGLAGAVMGTYIFMGCMFGTLVTCKSGSHVVIVCFSPGSGSKLVHHDSKLPYALECHGNMDAADWRKNICRANERSGGLQAKHCKYMLLLPATRSEVVRRASCRLSEQ